MTHDEKPTRIGAFLLRRDADSSILGLLLGLAIAAILVRWFLLPVDTGRNIRAPCGRVLWRDAVGYCRTHAGKCARSLDPQGATVVGCGGLRRSGRCVNPRSGLRNLVV